MEEEEEEGSQLHSTKESVDVFVCFFGPATCSPDAGEAGPREAPKFRAFVFLSLLSPKISSVFPLMFSLW